MLTFKPIIIFEKEINFNGYSYLVIYGHHINGYFCCIPNFKKSCEMSQPTDTFYNIERLVSAGFNKNTASAISKGIADICKNINEDFSCL